MISGELLTLLLLVDNLDTLNTVNTRTLKEIRLLIARLPLLVDASARSFAAFGQGTGPIHLDDLQCQGFEDALVNCSYDSNTADCSHFEDAGVVCQRKNVFKSCESLYHEL